MNASQSIYFIQKGLAKWEARTGTGILVARIYQLDESLDGQEFRVVYQQPEGGKTTRTVKASLNTVQSRILKRGVVA